MEFTTRFGLHSQATRLRGKGESRRVRAPAMGLTPALGGATIRRTRTAGRERQFTFLYATVLDGLTAAEIRRWALPASLAVTEGILVSFFSSAYLYA